MSAHGILPGFAYSRDWALSLIGTAALKWIRPFACLQARAALVTSPALPTARPCPRIPAPRPSFEPRYPKST